jgi:predicted house-cleaning NTP pyrophosphatase (Maf/HAM1 superfamily)
LAKLTKNFLAKVSRFIPRIDGSYSNVVGLPVDLVYRMLNESGVAARREELPAT